MKIITSRTALVVPRSSWHFVELRCYVPTITADRLGDALAEAMAHMSEFSGDAVAVSALTLSSNRAGAHFAACFRVPTSTDIYARLTQLDWKEAKS